MSHPVHVIIVIHVPKRQSREFRSHVSWRRRRRWRGTALPKTHWWRCPRVAGWKVLVCLKQFHVVDKSFGRHHAWKRNYGRKKNRKLYYSATSTRLLTGTKWPTLLISRITFISSTKCQKHRGKSNMNIKAHKRTSQSANKTFLLLSIERNHL